MADSTFGGVTLQVQPNRTKTKPHSPLTCEVNFEQLLIEKIKQAECPA